MAWRYNAAQATFRTIMKAGPDIYQRSAYNRDACMPQNGWHPMGKWV